MFLIRRARVDDVSTLLKLARMVHFINLPPDKDIIAEKIANSRNSFLRAGGRADVQRPESRALAPGTAPGLGESISMRDLFMFVLEDTESPSCLGTSQLVSGMGGPGNPNVCFRLERRERFSQSLQVGVTTVVAKLHLDESAPTEIGGLILQPSFRGHPRRLGRFLSLVRFHFIALHRELFADEILAEMMAPITPDGQNLLWEYLGRRFIPLSYTEADKFCQYSREFMIALLPKEDLHLSLLPPEARSVVGQVGPETVPARRMLERLGFEYRNFVDPFDGGPFLHAATDSIPPVRDTRRIELGPPVAKSKCKGRGMISVLDTDGEFRAVHEEFHLDEEAARLRLPRDVMNVLQAEPGMEAGVTPEPRAARRASEEPASDGSAGAPRKRARA